MNPFFRTCRPFALLAALALPHINWAITINGQELKEIIKQGQVLIYENQKANHIALRIQNGAIQIGQLDIQDDITRVKKFYDEFRENKAHLSCQSANETYTSYAGARMTIDGAYITAGKDIDIRAAHVSTFNSILQSKDIHILCSSDFKAYTCFMDADTLTLESPLSLFQAIRFTFSKDPSVPPLVQGTIDFLREKTDDGALVVIGACKLEISFSPQVFE